VALVADGEKAAGLAGDAGHLFAVGDGFGHEFFAEDMLAFLHGFDGAGGVEMEGEGDDDELDIVAIEELFVVVVEGDIGGFGAVFCLEGDAGFALLRGADFADGDEAEELGVEGVDVGAALAAGADEGGADGVAAEGGVAPVEGGDGGEGDESGEEFAAREGVVEVVLGGLADVLGDVHGFAFLI